MLRVSNLTKYFADSPVLLSVSFLLNPGERAGIVGANGSGKSTLLRIIAGLELCDGGSVWLDKRTRLGYLRQGVLGDEAMSIAEALASGGAVWRAHLAMEATADALGLHAADAACLARYTVAVERFEDLGGYAELDRVDEVLRGLDLAGLDPTRTIGTLSGGQKTRLGLAALLVDQPDILLLDEPTNHLDVDGLRWLEAFLQAYRGAALIVSHDRAFLDATVTTVLALDDVTHMLTAHPGDFTAYVAARDAALADQWERYRRQEQEHARIAADIRRTKEQAREVEGRTQLDYRGDSRFAKGAGRVRAAKVARKARVRERKLEKVLASGDTVEKPKAGWGLRLDFAATPGGAREVLRLESVSKSFGRQPVLRDVGLLVRFGERVAITGPNGGGKSTLLKLVTGDLWPDSGLVRLGANVVAGYYSQEQEGLALEQTPIEAIRSLRPMTEAEARTLLHGYLFGGESVFTPIGRLSYGERARLVVARLILSRANLLLLDEPTNHLDIPARERFEAALTNFTGTMLMVLHDRYAIERLATRVLELRDGQFHEIPAPVQVSGRAV